LNRDYQRVSMSGVRNELLERQAHSLGLPVIKVWVPADCTNQLYEDLMSETHLSAAFDGIEHVAFADLFLADLRAHREEHLAAVNKRGVFPLWGRDTATLAHQMIAEGFKAIVVAVAGGILDSSFAGRAFDEKFLADLPEGVDPCGENGEFHTFVWDGPLFDAPISCLPGEVVTRDGFHFCDVVGV
jgi:uncharacterized protein (TIGR00290 family)